MKKALLFSIIMVASVASLADRMLTYLCSDDDIEVTFTQITDRRGRQQRAAMTIVDNEGRHEWNALAGSQNELTIATKAEETIVTGHKNGMNQFIFTIRTLTDAGQSYSGTLTLIRNQEEQVIEFPHCAVSNEPTKTWRPLRNIEERHTRPSR